MPRFPSGCGGFVFGGLCHGPGRPIGPVLPMRTRAGEVPAEPVTGPLAILAGHRAEPLAAADVSQSWFANSSVVARTAARRRPQPGAATRGLAPNRARLGRDRADRRPLRHITYNSASL